MGETQTSKAIRDALEQLGVWVIRLQVGSFRVGGRYVRSGEPGLPDLWCPALNACLEVKTQDGALSAEQTLWHQRAKEAGVRVAVVRSVSEAVKVVTLWQRLDEHDRVAGWK